MAGYSKELLEETMEVWQRKSGNPVSPDEADEIIHNMSQFIKLLARLDEKYCEKKEINKGQ
jgi:hypothetical protein